MKFTAMMALVLSSAMFLAGCATAPAPLPSELQYQGPAASEDVASIMGSQEASSWADDYTAFIQGVDGKIVMSGRKGWNTPLTLTPGTHSLLVQLQRGSYRSSAVLQVPAASGAKLVLKYSTDLAMYGTNSYCDFWVADSATDKPVSTVVRGPIGGGAGNTGYVPVFIPKR